jgi:hypothetical protein
MSKNLLENRVIKEGILLYARSDRLLTRVQEAVTNAAAGFFDHALTVEEKAELSNILYDYAFRRSLPDKGLTRWEEAWFKKQLPKPPSRLLIGAAGNGREVAVLSKAGYQIDAFEPAPRAAEQCAKVLGVQDRVYVGRYEDLNKAVIDHKESPLSKIASQSYDAIVLGWGSLSHVLDSIERKRLFQSCRRLGTNAPILASFCLMLSDDSDENTSRARKVGSRLGRILAGFRGNRSRPFEDLFGSWFGYAHVFTKDEIEELAECSQSRAVWESNKDYPHVTFLPK